MTHCHWWWCADTFSSWYNCRREDLWLIFWQGILPKSSLWVRMINKGRYHLEPISWTNNQRRHKGKARKRHLTRCIWYGHSPRRLAEVSGTLWRQEGAVLIPFKYVVNRLTVPSKHLDNSPSIFVYCVNILHEHFLLIHTLLIYQLIAFFSIQVHDSCWTPQIMDGRKRTASCFPLDHADPGQRWIASRCEVQL